MEFDGDCSFDRCFAAVQLTRLGHRKHDHASRAGSFRLRVARPQGLVDFHGGSSSEHVAALAPGARLVKAMNTLFMSNVATGAREGRFSSSLFFSSDDHAAKSIVADLFESVGFAPIGLGSLATDGRIQAVDGPIAGHDFFLLWPAPRALSVQSSDDRRD